MALTRVTSTVIGDNAVTADKLADNSLVTRLYGNKSIPLAALSDEANPADAEARLDANINTVQTNVNAVHANVVASEANIILANAALSLAVNANFIATYINITANLDIVQDNVVAAEANVVAVETRRNDNIAGAVATITTSDLTASRALVSDGSGKVAVLASVTSTELGYVDATSSIQTQLNAGVTNAAAVVTEA